MIISLYYALINIVKFIRNNFFLAAAVIISQLAAILGILLSVGFINNSLEEKMQAEDYERQFTYYFYVNDTDHDIDKNDPSITFAPKYKEITDRIDELLEFCEDDFDYIFFYGESHYKNDAVSFCSSIGYTEDEDGAMIENSLQPIVIAGDGELATEITSRLDINDAIMIGNKRFTVAKMTENQVADFYLPYKYIPSDSVISGIQLALKDAPTQVRVKQIRNKFCELFGNPESFAVPKIKDLINEQTNNMYIGVSVIVMIIVMLNLSLYYKYVYDLRIRQSSVFRICGASKKNILAELSFEIIIVSLFSLIIALLLFTTIKEQLYDDFAGFVIYDSKIYLYAIITAYIISSVAMAIIVSYPYIRISPVCGFKNTKE